MTLFEFETQIRNPGQEWEPFTTLFLASDDQTDSVTLRGIAQDWLLTLHRTLADTDILVAFDCHIRGANYFTIGSDDKPLIAPYRFVGIERL